MRSIRRTVTVAVLTAVVLCTTSLTSAFAEDAGPAGGLGTLATGADFLTKTLVSVAGLR
ncbi:hypothetical protein [Streptomyces violascens]|uniref:hypothetical protein n=1 Tax=Streptomyces violascens TaxID=67381 RepID=UPI003658196B